MITIAVGVGENKNILKAIEIFKKSNNSCNIIKFNKDTDLIDSFDDKNIDIIIRGSLDSHNILKSIKNKNNNVSRATYIKNKDYEFLLSPVGIDEGNSTQEKLNIVENCENFIKNINLTPKIAILANGRKEDYGRRSNIDESLSDSEELFELVKENTSSEVNNYYILIEKAIKEKNNIIIAPNGIIGNILFRSLVLINNWPSYGAITFGLNKKYIDTSRDQSIEGYVRSLELGYKLSKENFN